MNLPAIMKKETSPNDPVLLDTFTNDVDANIVRGVLESNGVPCIVNGENMNVIYGGIPSFSVRLYVRRTDLDLARRILDSDVAPDVL